MSESTNEEQTTEEDHQFVFVSADREEAVPLSVQQAEEILLKHVREGEQDPCVAFQNLVCFYDKTGQQRKAVKAAKKLLSIAEHVPEAKAFCLMNLGRIMEHMHDFEQAAAYLRDVVALEPVDPDNWYFAHNNLGFSLNQLGRFEEGERYCRRATEINPAYANGYKNLGLSLEGQLRYREAAASYVDAMQANSADPRPLAHLEELIRRRPELMNEFQDDLEWCRRANADDSEDAP